MMSPWSRSQTALISGPGEDVCIVHCHSPHPLPGDRGHVYYSSFVCLNSTFSSSVQEFQNSLNSSMLTGFPGSERYFLRVMMEFSCSGTMAPFRWVCITG